MIKAFNKLGIEGDHLNVLKAIYEKATTNIVADSKKTEIISSKIRNK